MAGQLLAGRYELGPKIGEGAIAVVYRATDLSLGREVAIKVLKPEFCSDPEVVARFRAEAQRAARLTHPNIVQIFDAGESGGRAYIVMEYLPEPDLKQIILRYAPLPATKVAQVGIDCCRALEYAHSQGIVHRDIKPQNILFTSEGIAKLSDFGIAAAAGESGLTEEGLVVGTAAYMSPEQVQGMPVRPESDIYSLGCVLYEAATGRPPFTGQSAQEVMRKHLTERPVPMRQLNPSVSPSLEFIVSKAMQKDPSRRYPSAAEMRADLEKVAAGMELDRTGVLPGGVREVEPPRQPKPRPEIVRPAQQRPRMAAAKQAPSRPQVPLALAAALVVAVIALAVVAWLAKLAFYPSAMPKLVQVPPLKGLTEQQARAKLEQVGLKVGNIEYRYGDLYPPGQVIDQRPEMGTTVQEGTAVTLIINKGKRVVQVVDVEGLTVEEAARRLQRAGLTIGKVEKRYDDRVPEGHVIEQAIKPGIKVEEGTAVDLVVSRGPQPAQPQQAEQEQQAAAEGIEGAGQEQPETEPVYPSVELQPDPSYTPDAPGKQRYILRVTVLGRKPRQHVQVVVRDESAKRLKVLDEYLSPNEHKTIPIILQGSATIRVYHEGRLVTQEIIPAPGAPSEGGAEQ